MIAHISEYDKLPELDFSSLTTFAIFVLNFLINCNPHETLYVLTQGTCEFEHLNGTFIQQLCRFLAIDIPEVLQKAV